VGPTASLRVKLFRRAGEHEARPADIDAYQMASVEGGVMTLRDLSNAVGLSAALMLASCRGSSIAIGRILSHKVKQVLRQEIWML
jgi:hypothetical protein